MIDFGMLRTPFGAVATIIVIRAAMAAAGKDLNIGYGS